MIKRTNPDNKNKKELAIELLKIKEKHISKLKSNIENVKKIKSKLIDLKIEINKKDGFFYQAKIRVKAAFLAEDLIQNGLDYEYLKKLHDESIKDPKYFLINNYFFSLPYEKISYNLQKDNNDKCTTNFFEKGKVKNRDKVIPSELLNH